MRRFAALIDAFQHATGAPPRSFAPFMGWALAGSWKWLWIAGIFSAIAGVMEVVSALMLGRVIDAALASQLDAFWAENLTMLPGGPAADIWFVGRQQRDHRRTKRQPAGPDAVASLDAGTGGHLL